MPEETLTSKLQPLDKNAALADYDRETMIKVDHVTMEFNMASEQLSSLKEYAIALAKRKLYFEKFTALDDISFEVKKGDVFGILGTNGSGKSTLLKIIAGVLEPTVGSCEINGNIAPLIELGAGFDMELSARENIYLNGSLLGYSKQFIEDHFDDIVDFAEIEKFLDMPMKNYSSGMIARIAFAIATVIVPEILIVDEVLSVGDFMFQQKCENRINDLIENHGVTVLIVSHSNDQIERLCNKAIWIEKGHTRIIGDATQVCNAYRVLGGRTGSKESESYIYKFLNQIRYSSNGITKTTTISDTNCEKLGIELAQLAWGNETIESVILVPDYTHAFSVAASGIAGALNAPIIPFDKSKQAFELLPLIKSLMPSRVLVLAHYNVADTLAQSQEFLDCFKDVVPISSEGSIQGIRISMIAFGLKHNLWDTNEAIALQFDDCLESFAASPLAFINKCPLLLFDNSENTLDSDTLELLRDSRIENITLIGKICDSPIASSFEKNSFNIELIPYQGNHFLDIEKFVEANADVRNSLLCVASKNETNWQNFLSSPSFCGHQKSSLLFEDNADLDLFASILKAINQLSPKHICFFGNNTIPIIEQKIIQAASLSD